jgi:hypothetical protein
MSVRENGLHSQNGLKRSKTTSAGSIADEDRIILKKLNIVRNSFTLAQKVKITFAAKVTFVAIRETKELLCLRHKHHKKPGGGGIIFFDLFLCHELAESGLIRNMHRKTEKRPIYIMIFMMKIITM